MSRRVLLGGVVSAVVLALCPASAVADTVDAVPTQALTLGYVPQGVARNPANGTLYVSGSDGQIHVYAGNATGAAAALWAMSMPAGCDPWQLTFDPTGSALLVACTTVVQEVDPNTLNALHSWTGLVGARSAVYDGGGKVLVTDYAADTVVAFDASTSGTGTPELSGIADPTGIAYADGMLYVASHATDTVLEFPHTPGGGTYGVPARTITLPADVNETNTLALDAAGNLYVGAFTGGVLLYPPGANGAATPTRRLVGPSFGIGTVDLDAFPDGRLGVGQMDSSGQRVVVVPPQVPPASQPTVPSAVAPGAVTALKVTGPKTARKRTVTWAAGPAGSSPITSYAVVVTKGSKKVVTRTTTLEKVVLKRKKLVKGRLMVTVTAVNAVAAGPPVSTAFTVKMPVKMPGKRPQPG